MFDLTYKDLLHASNVKRWHCADMSKEQTVADHQWRVMVISAALCEVYNVSFYGTMELALFHDIEEVLVGDPPPVGKTLTHSEKVTVNMPTIIATQGRSFISEKSVWIVKMADLAEAYLFVSKYGRDLGETKALLERIRIKIIRHTNPADPQSVFDLIRKLQNDDLTKEHADDRT